MESQERIDQIRELNGCYDKIKDPARFHRHSNIIFKRCVCSVFDNNIHTLIEIYDYFKVHKTVPPNYMYKGKGVGSRLMTAIKVIDGFINEKQAEEMRKQTEAIKKQNQGLKRG